ncbi:SusC/RagA family TonB-linked outer membrane protein [Flavobacterium sediminis]|uniref:SusC/RagA family TonB-linked outer membrane protein n=1 Tax=Flavobacterium sediminis TaxID=2201181 RepID=A0A2U8QWG6_9FLAO|nr:SusC/RagA family TonB-linked outer membrane protein [Flavobacterium sediminis]AWM14552.1 SusC/RagA family TonB-linked outer membrane protein [Flavobacterium sediminis]
MRQILVIISMLFIPIVSLAQEIKGNVVDEFGTPLSGVTIQVLETEKYSITDFDGNFTIEAKEGQDLKFTMIGMEDLVAKATTNMNVVMKESLTQLNDIVMVGYGVRKKIDNTSSIVSLKAEDISERKVQNAVQAVQGKVAGVNITSSDAPGSQPSVIIRGINSIEGGRSPLYVVDGVFMDDITNINSSDIVTFDVLKDASSLAIYGTRGANGVIIITTKQGKGDKMDVTIDSNYGIRMPLKKVKMSGSNLFALYNNTALGTITFSQDQPVNTNWFDEITRTGTYSQNNITLSGSTKAVDYMLSSNFYDEDAILNGQGYSRVTIRNNNKFKFNDNIYLKQNINVAFVNNTPKPYGAFTAAYKQSPAVPVYFNTGQYGVPLVGDDGFVSTSGTNLFNNVGNPVAMLNFHNEQQKNLNLIGAFEFGAKLFDGLKFTSNFGIEYNTFKSYNFVDSKNIWLAADPTRTSEAYDALDPAQPVNLLTKTRNSNYKYNWSGYFTYSNVFADIHDVELTAGVETVYDDGNEYLAVTYRDVPANENYWYYSFSTSDLSNTINEVKNNSNRILSYFGRLQYKLMDKYLVSATLRRDGSSRFQKDYRWGTFPSVGIGWIVSREDFLADINFVNFLKVRGSWGKLGNQKVPLNQLPFTSGLDYSYGNGYPSAGITVSSIVDPELTWEVVEELSGGVDFEVLDSRLKGSFDLYHKKTDKIIIPISAYLTSGTASATYAYAGSVSNKGYEIALRWDDKINDNLSYWISGNLTQNKNELTSLSDNISAQTGGGLGNGQYTKVLNQDAVGQPLGSFYLWEQAGYDDQGNMTFYDKDGNVVAQDQLTEDDRKFVGSVMPKTMYGFSVGVKYKNFDLSVDAYGTAGAKIYNGKKAQRFGGENVEYDVASDFWTSTNTNAGNPAPFNTVPIASTYYLESGDFLRINNISFGYTLPKFTKVISSARIYFNAINPFIFQKYSGYSPEINGDGNPFNMQGIELDAYPTLRSFVFGVNLKL